MDKSFHPTLHWACNYLSMLGLKLKKERGPRQQAISWIIVNSNISAMTIINSLWPSGMISTWHPRCRVRLESGNGLLSNSPSHYLKKCWLTSVKFGSKYKTFLWRKYAWKYHLQSGCLFVKALTCELTGCYFKSVIFKLGLVQDCSICFADTLEILQYCTDPLISPWSRSDIFNNSCEIALRWMAQNLPDD